MAYREKLRGTSETIYQIGIKGHQWKYGDSDTVGATGLEARDKDDAAYCRVRGADPVDNQDLITLSYFNTNNSVATNIVCATITVGTSSLTTVGSIPDAARIVDVRLIVDTPYSAGGTVAAALTGSTSLMASGDNDAEDAAGEIFSVPQDTAVSGGAKTVDITVGGTPGAGASRVQVYYVTPTDITT